MGRPSGYTPEMADLICERIAYGESLKKICEDETMPGKTAVYKWLNEVAGFADKYVRAREVQADTIFDEILEIANTPLIGEKSKIDKEGNVIETTKGDMIEHRRLQIDARKWMAAKLRPKVYGDRVLNEHSGVDGAPIETLDVTPEKRRAAVAVLLARKAKG